MDCQKQSSSAFGLAVWMERDAVEFTSAEPRTFRRRGESGGEKHRAFCGACGTRLYHAGGGFRAEGSTTLGMKAGTLGDTSVVVPTNQLWTKRAQPWLAPLPTGGVCFGTEPDSEHVLRAQWRDAG